MSAESHPINVDLKRILSILAKQIYTTPFAFLRENVQNAFDAVHIQMFRESKDSQPISDHKININVNRQQAIITDTGIGMTPDDLKGLFWTIGKSGKHTPEAESAGVVGTFGIGGMANFGACSKLTISTQTQSGTRIRCWAERDKLSANKESVFYESEESADRGTTVTGMLVSAITSDDVKNYLAPIVQYLDVPVVVNGQLLSKVDFPSIDDSDQTVNVTQDNCTLAISLKVSKKPAIQIEVSGLIWNGKPTPIRAVFSNQSGVISAFRHGFKLADVAVPSAFQLSGIIDCKLLHPTAGREAVTDESRQFIHQLIGTLEKGLAEHIAAQEDLADRFSLFYRYVGQHRRWDLAGNSTIKVYGTQNRVLLGSLATKKVGHVYYAYDEHDTALLQAYLDNGKTVAILSKDENRRPVESEFLKEYCKASLLSQQVNCLKVIDELPFAELTLRMRIQERLRRQFLVDSQVSCGELTQDAMVWVPQQSHERKLVVFLDVRRPQLRRLIELHDSPMFDTMCDVFIQQHIYPHLSRAFPELKKRDFDAMLKRLQATVEQFEVDPDDVTRLQQLADMTDMEPEMIARILGGRRFRDGTRGLVRRSDVRKMSELVNYQPWRSVEDMQQELKFRFLEVETDSVKILDATAVPPELKLSRYYFAATQEAHLLYRRIFLEREPSSIFSWGGHRAGYLFYSEGISVVYYDIHFDKLIESDSPGMLQPGSRSMENQPLISKNMIYLPIPDELRHFMVPSDSILQFTIHHQIIGVNDNVSNLRYDDAQSVEPVVPNA